MKEDCQLSSDTLKGIIDKIKNKLLVDGDVALLLDDEGKFKITYTYMADKDNTELSKSEIEKWKKESLMRM